ncbi:hypothetical protein H6P81_006061 [Aristolochia fimbriata]|uniref:Uncharacterized protein n=1 Tax=Aristolochia fimbriata TaxID=158543 RepID=A0AAV7EWE6_ARIFI|nr:hypothetical protein H6P81_006061 [Aristolochia fimbriata]
MGEIEIAAVGGGEIVAVVEERSQQWWERDRRDGVCGGRGALGETRGRDRRRNNFMKLKIIFMIL